MQEPPAKTVLIIEDEPNIRALYKEILIEAGFNVIDAADGIDGMNKIKNTHWDVLLLDIMLPGKDGIKILHDIKENPAYKKGAVVALTNLNSDNIIKEVFSEGADGYLIKSEIMPDKVITEVKSFVQDKKTV